MKKIILFITLFAMLPISCNREKGEVTILYTNDVHGQIDGKLSYATVGQMKKDYKERGENVLLLDAGDHISGGLYTAYDDGKSIVEAMSKAGYDAATLGNHEFDYNFDYLKQLMKQATYPYISTNFYNMKDNVPTTRFTDLGSKIFKLKGIRVGVIGISTPDSITTSTPSHFQDEKGNFIYTFLDDQMYEKIQQEIDSIKNNCDYIIALSHIGNSEKDAKYTSKKLAEKTSGIDVIIDGHTHQVERGDKPVKDKNNKDVMIVQTGSHFNAIGKITISKKGKITNEFINSYSSYDKDIKNIETNVVDTIESILGLKLANSVVPFTTSGEKECSAGDLAAESPYYYYNFINKKYGCDFAIYNSGGLRSNINRGVWTLKTCRTLHSFGTDMALKKVKGETIKKALEFSAYKYPTYFGGFQQVCGITFKIDKNVVSDIQTDAHGSYISGPSIGHERVSDIKVYDKATSSFVPFDINKEYNVASTAYVIRDCGDGLSMFKEGEMLDVETTYVDYVMLGLYVSNFKVEKEGELPILSSENSPLNAYKNLTINYREPFCANRISEK